MRKKFNPYTLPPWVRNIRNVLQQFIIPFCVFQGVRTLLIPTSIDVLLLCIFVLIALAFYFNWI